MIIIFEGKVSENFAILEIKEHWPTLYRETQYQVLQLNLTYLTIPSLKITSQSQYPNHLFLKIMGCDVMHRTTIISVLSQSVGSRIG